MAALHERHPQFGWARNAGYGTPAHLEALRRHGPCAQHRSRFVATAMGGEVTAADGRLGRRAKPSARPPRAQPDLIAPPGARG